MKTTTKDVPGSSANRPGTSKAHSPRREATRQDRYVILAERSLGIASARCPFPVIGLAHLGACRTKRSGGTFRTAAPGPQEPISHIHIAKTYQLRKSDEGLAAESDAADTVVEAAAAEASVRSQAPGPAKRFPQTQRKKVSSWSVSSRGWVTSGSSGEAFNSRSLSGFSLRCINYAAYLSFTFTQMGCSGSKRPSFEKPFLHLPERLRTGESDRVLRVGPHVLRRHQTDIVAKLST